jgi:hypothetical protein
VPEQALVDAFADMERVGDDVPALVDDVHRARQRRGRARSRELPHQEEQRDRHDRRPDAARDRLADPLQARRERRRAGLERKGRRRLSQGQRSRIGERDRAGGFGHLRLLTQSA